MSVFTTTIIADAKKYPVLLGNGNIASNYKTLENGQQSITWFDPHPKSAHLFALVAGDLGSISDEFTTASGEHVGINIYCDLGNESKCHHAMKSLKEAMIWDEENYGCEYDLEIYNIVAVDSFNMGAMENKGLNIFNTAAVLADNDVASDDNFMRIQAIIAHEYFHNWTGNRVTCKNWFQLTLKEGLTVFRDQCFSADLNSKEVTRIEEVKGLRMMQFVEDASPTAHPIQPKSYISMNNFYTSTVYDKGAEVIRMMHTLIGEKAYRKATDLYFKTFDGKAATTEDFLWCMSEASGHDFTAFKKWYDQSGTPTIKVEESFENGTYNIHIKQVIPNTVDGKEQDVYYFPLKIGVIDSEGKELLEQILRVSKVEETFSFSDLKEKPYLSLNRNFSAPIIVEQNNADHKFGMKHDNNAFARFDAAQAFGIESIENIMQTGEVNQEFIEAYADVLELDIDFAFKALLLELPSSSILMQRQEPIDFELIDNAIDTLSATLATVHKEKLLELYHEHHEPKNSELDNQSMAKRSLKNICLKMLSALKTKEIITLAQKQYQESVAMGDRTLALDIIENSTAHHREEELNHFYEQYKDNTLVMNKYLSILALSSRDGLLARVIALQQHEVYDEKVPNLLRSLIGGFIGNRKFFHAKDGSGYQFIATKLIDIDSINAQMSSRLAGSFKLYDKMNETNKKLMKVELERVITSKNISKNLYEILAKILKV